MSLRVSILVAKAEQVKVSVARVSSSVIGIGFFTCYKNDDHV